jgi:hypothetical protein
MTLTIQKDQQPTIPPQEPFNEWRLPGGRLWSQFYRTESGYLLWFPNLAAFEVSADGIRVQAYPLAGADEGTVQHLYLNQVLPLMLSKQGRQVFHGSAVALEPGAVVFVGESGRGKSTLAASFAMHGIGFLTDDGLVLRPSDNGYLVEPSHPSIRLWDDSGEALVEIGANITPPVTYTSKTRFLAGDHLRFCNRPRPLHRIYFLGDDSSENISFARMRPAEAMIELLKHSFLLDPEGQTRLTSHFEQIARLAQLPISYRLDFPRRYEAIDQVRAAIMSHAGGGKERELI